MPEATEEKNACAEATEMLAAFNAKYVYSRRGNVSPQIMLAAAYSIGINQRGIWS
jgi:hypothetical protein